MSRFCEQCGAQLEPNENFCPSCGAKVIRDEQPTYTPPQQSYTPPPTAPWMKNPPPSTYTPSSQPPPQPIYTPPEDTTPHYKEDVTFQEKFLTSEGRLNRWRYFCRTLAVVLIYLVVCLIIFSACSTPWGDLTQTGDALVTVAAVILLIPKFHLDVRRMKDSAKFDNESTIQLFAGVPAVISLAFIFNPRDWDFSSMPPHLKLLSFIDVGMWVIIQFPAGTVEPNKYGADPLENERR